MFIIIQRGEYDTPDIIHGYVTAEVDAKAIVREANRWAKNVDYEEVKNYYN